MIILTVDEIVFLHDKLIKATGGAGGILDYGLLESAVYSIYAGFGDVEKYVEVDEKAARLAFAIISNHAFADGNKRIGILAMLIMLRLNDYSVLHTQAELISLGMSAASGKIQYQGILEWIRQHRLK